MSSMPGSYSNRDSLTKELFSTRTTCDETTDLGKRCYPGQRVTKARTASGNFTIPGTADNYVVNHEANLPILNYRRTRAGI